MAKRDLTIEEAAKYLSVSITTVQKLVEFKMLAAIENPDGPRFRRDELKQLKHPLSDGGSFIRRKVLS